MDKSQQNEKQNIHNAKKSKNFTFKGLTIRYNLKENILFLKINKMRQSC